MKCGFKLTLFWRCLQLRFSQSLSVCVSFFQSVYLRFTQSKKTLQFLLFSSCLLILLVVSGIDQVQAQTETPTVIVTSEATEIIEPTPTYVPIFQPDPDEVMDYTCPGVMPRRWGEVTPSAWWYMNCMRCITPTPAATHDFGDNPFIETPITLPSNTPTPSTGNKTEQVLHSEAGLLQPLQEYRINHNIEMVTNPNFELYIPVSERPGSTHTQYFLKFSNLQNYPGSSWSGDEGKIYNLQIELSCWVDECKITNNLTNEIINLTDGKYYIYYQQQLDVKPMNLFLLPEQDMEVVLNDVLYQPTNKGLWIRIKAKAVTGAPAVATSTTTIIWDDQPLPNTRGSFCEEVQDGGDQGVGDDSDIFSLPIIAAGEGECIFFGEFTVPLGWLEAVWENAQDIYLPSWSICFKPISFGEFRLFGYSYDMDLIALAMAGVVIIRILTRS